MRYILLAFMFVLGSCGTSKKKSNGHSGKDTTTANQAEQLSTSLATENGACSDFRNKLLDSKLISNDEFIALEKYNEISIFIEEILYKTVECDDIEKRQKFSVKAADEGFRSKILSQRSIFNDCEVKRLEALKRGEIDKRLYILLKQENEVAIVTDTGNYTSNLCPVDGLSD